MFVIIRTYVHKIIKVSKRYEGKIMRNGNIFNGRCQGQRQGQGRGQGNRRGQGCRRGQGLGNANGNFQGMQRGRRNLGNA